MKRFLKIILTVVLYAILPFVVITLITSNTGVLGGIRSFVVLTGSMEPALPVGSIVYTKTVKENGTRYKTGDIIAFDQSGRTVTHRVVGVVEDGGVVRYKTRGDANNTDDSELVAQEKVIGREISSLPYLGRLVGFLKTVPGFLTLIVIPGILFIVYELWNIKKELVKETEKKVLARMQETK